MRPLEWVFVVAFLLTWLAIEMAFRGIRELLEAVKTLLDLQSKQQGVISDLLNRVARAERRLKTKGGSDGEAS